MRYMLLAVLGFFSHCGMMFMLNARGETGAGGGKEGNAGGQTDDKSKTFTQDQVDQIVKERLGREKEKYRDYDDLKKFRDDAQKQLDEKNLKTLEEQKRYEEALKLHNDKLAQYDGLVKQKDQTITDMTISHALLNELSAQGAYVEESLALLKSNAVIENGVVVIKGKDDNGIETKTPISEGVKKFLASRPHLVKATQRQGSGGNGSGGGNGNGGNGGGSADDLMTLNQQFLEAKMRGDNKTAAELATKIKANFSSRNVTRSI